MSFLYLVNNYCWSITSEKILKDQQCLFLCCQGALCFCNTCCAASMGVDGTFMVMGSNPHYLFSEKGHLSHTHGLRPSHFSWEVAVGSLCCKDWRQPFHLQCTRMPSQPMASAHLPTPPFFCFSQKYFCFIFLCLCSTVIKGASDKHPVLHYLLRQLRWVLRWEQTLICGDTGLGGVSHQWHFCRGLRFCKTNAYTRTPAWAVCERGVPQSQKYTSRGWKKKTTKSFRVQTARETVWLSSTAGGAACWDVEHLSCDSWWEPQDVSGNQHLDKKDINNTRKVAGLVSVCSECWALAMCSTAALELGQPGLLKLPLHHHLLQVRIWSVLLHPWCFPSAWMRTVDQKITIGLKIVLNSEVRGQTIESAHWKPDYRIITGWQEAVKTEGVFSGSSSATCSLHTSTVSARLGTPQGLQSPQSSSTCGGTGSQHWLSQPRAASAVGHSWES